MGQGIHKVSLTGGIASGKSEVGHILTRHGVPIIDADDVVHDLLRQDAQLKANIRQEFGPDVFDPQGDVDRKKLGQKVFGFPEKKTLLESWIHPKVRQKIQGFFERQQQLAHKIAVAIIPLLFENNLEVNYDEVWLIKTDEKTQKERVLKRNPELKPEDVDKRIQSQMPFSEKLQRLQAFQTGGKQTAVISNDGTLDDLGLEVLALLKK